MLWFKHFADARRNPKLLRVERKMPDGYGRFFRLLEVVATYGGKGKNFRPELDLNGKATDLEWLAAELNIDPAQAEETLALFAGVGLIDAGGWANRIVAIPAMSEYKDEYTTRRQKTLSPQESKSNEEKESKSKQNGECPDCIPTLSGHEGKTDVTDVLKLEGPTWRVLEISTLPDGFQNFVTLAEATEPRSGETIASWGNRVMKAAKAKGILYPKVFLKVIAGLERTGDMRSAMRLHPGSMQSRIDAERKARGLT